MRFGQRSHMDGTGRTAIVARQQDGLREVLGGILRQRQQRADSARRQPPAAEGLLHTVADMPQIEDLRAFANIVRGRKKAPNVTVLIVPGSKMVERQAREEGLEAILEDAGFRLREPGCSSCLAMNEDKIPPRKYAVSTSNRNFEGRQGPGARTLLASPLTAAAAANT